MRQRVRLDLGQKVASDRERERFERKGQRWALVNRNKDSKDNPFMKAISPAVANYGDADETIEELNQRLDNFEFGNFRGYFNYRNKAAVVQDTKQATTNSAEEIVNKDDTKSIPWTNAPDKESIDVGEQDERISHFKEEWLKGKIVLDIGCNRGHITYALARQFNPRSMVGIDIDPKLIMMANRDIHMHLNESLIEPRREMKLKLMQLADQPKQIDTDKHVDRDQEISSGSQTDKIICDKLSETRFPISNYIDNGPIACDNEDDKFPNNLIFVEHNYVPSSDELAARQKEHFDTIICLSVTKWIHLNYRDEGLKRFFKRAYNHLKPGGLFILEAQPFDNYSRRKRTSDRLKANFYSIQLKPEEFDNYLLSDEIGFKEIIYESKINHQCKGFKRPLKVFMK